MSKFNAMLPLGCILAWASLNLFDGITSNTPVNTLKGLLGLVGVVYCLFYIDKLNRIANLL